MSPITIKGKERGLSMKRKYLQVPCGQCLGCLSDKSKMWAIRLEEELKASTSAHFVTFTYNADHIPISNKGFAVLRKKDMQDYFKRLRKNTSYKAINPDTGRLKTYYLPIRYFCVGEYGSKTKRPHYHALIFNLSKNTWDAKVQMQRAWMKDGVIMGKIDVGKVEPASIAYCTKYVIMKNQQDWMENPPFAIMSKGIGRNYIERLGTHHKNNPVSRCEYTKPGGAKITLPRYYREKLYNKGQLTVRAEKIQSELQIKEQKQVDKDNGYQNHLRLKNDRIEAKKRIITKQIKDRKI